MATASDKDHRKMVIEYDNYFCGIDVCNPSRFEFKISEFPICELIFNHESGYRNLKEREDDPDLAALDKLFAIVAESRRRILPIEEFWLKEGFTQEEVHILHSCIQELITSACFPTNKDTIGIVMDIKKHPKVSEIFNKIIAIPSLKDDLKLFKEVGSITYHYE